jgi:negative regulator of flagellin synthesis FlgM
VSSEVKSVNGGGPAAVGTGRVSQSPQTSSTPAPSSDSAESIHITDTASQLSALEQAVSGLPAVDEARVAAVSSSIEQGAYTISSQTIADRLVQLERSLGGLVGSG